MWPSGSTIHIADSENPENAQKFISLQTLYQVLIVLGYNITGEGCTLLARANGHDIDAEVLALRPINSFVLHALRRFRGRPAASQCSCTIPVFRLSAADRCRLLTILLRNCFSSNTVD